MKMRIKTLLLLVAAALLAAGCKKGSSPAPLPPPILSSDRVIGFTADNNAPMTGTNITFTLVAGNAGPDGSTGISVKDALPTGYSLVSSTPTTGSYSSGIWSGFGLAKGATATLTIVATVNPTGVYANTATISGTENDPVLSNN